MEKRMLREEKMEWEPFEKIIMMYRWGKISKEKMARLWGEEQMRQLSYRDMCAEIVSGESE